MTNLSTPAKALVCLLTMLPFLLISCQSEQNKSEKVDATNSSPVVSGSIISNSLSAIYLDSLLVSADSIFKADIYKKSDLVFEYFSTDTAITLEGWVLKKNAFGPHKYDESLRVMISNTVGKSNVALGPNTHFGNQVLYEKDVKKIVKDIKGKQATLHFKPQKDAVSGRIYYEITIQVESRGIKSFLIDSYSTNPSPPHQSFDN